MMPAPGGTMYAQPGAGMYPQPMPAAAGYPHQPQVGYAPPQVKTGPMAFWKEDFKNEAKKEFVRTLRDADF